VGYRAQTGCAGRRVHRGAQPRLAAGKSLANLVRLNVYTTDVDLLFQHYGVLASRLGAAHVAPTATMLGVTRLVIPGQVVELEGTAIA
jgi:enamine deaminase RidA (YjgF/YER057c/UK114 family)